jgi:hypothetical protein
MEKSDLKTGAIIEIADGDFGVVMLDTIVGTDVIVFDDGSFDYLTTYQDNLLYGAGEDHPQNDIVRVYRPTLTGKVGSTSIGDLIWERPFGG